MSPEEHLAQQNRMEKKIDDLLGKVVRIDTYQKTHYKTITEHTEALKEKANAEDVKNLTLRVDKTDKTVTRAGGGLATIVFLLGFQSFIDWFKGGGS